MKFLPLDKHSRLTYNCLALFGKETYPSGYPPGCRATVAEGWPSGLRRTLGKRVYSDVTRVRIPLPLFQFLEEFKCPNSACF